MSLERFYIAGMFYLLLNFPVFSQESGHDVMLNPSGTRNSAPVTDMFTSSDLMNNVNQNSVNLNSGDVSFSLPIVSLSTPSGLSYSFSASYNSNLEKVSFIRNQESPTGILGLGWSTPTNKIIADTKNTGTSVDDEYYWVSNGSTTKLIFKNNQTDYIKDGFGTLVAYDIFEYGLKNEPNTIVIYDPSKMLWTVKLSDGTKQYFGGRSDLDNYQIGLDVMDLYIFDYQIDHPTNGNSVEWGVRWGNWIGNSSKNGQSNYAVAWNLWKIENSTGDFLEFTYFNNLEFVGQTSTDPMEGYRKFTKSCYLAEVKDRNNRKIILNYSEKTADQIGDPHTEKGSEPDAYQERLETHFLGNLVNLDNGEQIFQINFGFGNSSGYAKKMLTSITKVNRNNIVEPAIKFTYYSNGGDEDLTKIQKIIYPSGGSIEYTYAPKNLGETSLDFKFEIPSGYVEPRVWTQDNYTIITVRKPDQHILLNVFEWKGKWVNTYSTVFSCKSWQVRLSPFEIYESEIVNYNGKNYQDFEIFTGNNFFSVIKNYYAPGIQTKPILLVHRAENSDHWLGEDHNVKMTDGKGGTVFNIPGVVIGDNFTFIYSYTTARFYMFVWKNNFWVKTDYYQSPFNQTHNTDNDNYEFYATGQNNYVYIHNARGDDKWQIFYLDQNRDIKIGSVLNETSGQGIDNDDFIKMRPSSNSVFEQIDNYDGYYNFWDINYNITKNAGIGDLDMITQPGGWTIEAYNDNQTVGVEDISGPDRYLHLYRFNGVSIQRTKISIVGQTTAFTGFGDNFAVSFLKKGDNPTYYPNKFVYQYYNPNTNTFDVPNGNPRSIVLGPDITSYRFNVGINFYTNGLGIYVKGSDDTNPINWPFRLTPLLDGTTGTLIFDPTSDESRTGPNFLIRNGKEYHEGGSPTTASSIIFIKNGHASTQKKIDDGWVFPDESLIGSGAPQLSNMMSNTTVVSYLGGVFNNTPWLNLHKIIDEQVNGVLTDRPVVSFKVSTGTQDLTTTIDYDLPTATTDPSGTVAQYHKVKVIQGTGAGYTETYFINGIPAADYLMPLTEEGGSNELSNLELLKGTPYKSIVYNEAGTVLSTSETKYKTTTFPIGSNEIGYLVRPVLSKSTQDGLTVSQVQAFNSIGQAVSSSVTNSDGKVYKSESKYASDLSIYSALKTDFNSDPVVQTVKWVDGKVVSSEVTTWKSWGTYWAPNKTFVWKYKTGQATIPYFNFSAWSGSSNPVPADGWVKTSEILERTTSGMVLVSQDMVGNFQSVQYQTAREIPIASYKFAKYKSQSIGADASFLNFEAGNLTSNADNDFWSFPGGTQTLLTQAEAHTGDYSLQIKGKISGGSRTLGLSKEFEPTDTKGKYLVTFWYKTESGYTSNSAKLLFHVKGTGTDTSNTSPGFVGSYVSGNKVLATAAGWTLVQSVLDLKAATGTGSGYRILVYLVNNDANQKSIYVDDLRFVPLLSEAKSTVYDTKLWIPTASIDNNNETTFPIYNASYQAVSGQDEFGVVRSVSQSYLSRSGSLTDEFSLSDPNATVSVSASNGGTWNHFNNGSVTGLTFNNVSVDSKQLKHTTLGTAGSVTFSSVSGTDYAVRLNLKNETSLASNPSYKFSIGNVIIQRTATQWNVTGITSPITLTVPSLPDWTDLLVVVKGDRLFVFADGKTIVQLTHSANLTGAVKFTYGTNTQGRLDDILVLNKPQLSVSYSDGMGRPLQRQGMVGSNLIVSGSVYDSNGRPAVQPKPVKYTKPVFGYRPNYVSAFDYTNDVISSDTLTIQYPNDGGFPFSRKEYEPSPLNRLIMQSRPGVNVNLASGKNLVNRFGNQTEPDVISGVNPQTHQITESVNDEGTRNISVKDKLGRSIYQLTGPLNTYNKVLTITKTSPTGQIYARSNQTITWQVTFGIMGDDPPSGGQYRWAYFWIGTSENSHDKVYEYYQIPGAPENLISTRSGSFAAVKGQTYYCNFYFVSQDGGVIDGTANITYQEQDFITTKTDYDDRGNVITVYTPNYFKVPFSGFSPTAYVQKAGYDAWSRKIWSWTMDADTVRYLYDNSGRVRFQVDAKSENTRPQKDTVNYFKYDKIGRLLEEGFFVTDFETLDSIKANNPDYPATSDNPKWKTQYVYDGELSGTTFVLNSRGDLIKRNHRNIDTEATSSAVQETFTYNSKGLITSKSLKVPGYSSSATYSTGYVYNNNNQVTQIDYPTSSLSVRYAYDDFGRVTTIGTATDADYFSAYTYDLLTGKTTTEQIATAGSASKTITYAYNSVGQLSSMSSNMFSESLTYYTGRDGDNLGYYDGKIASSFSGYYWVTGPSVPVYFTLRYKYDKAGRLTTANYIGTDLTLDNYDIGVGSNNETAYDMNGNILKMKEGTATAQQHMYYSGKNQIKNTNGTTNQDYVYDFNGNLSRSVKTGISKMDFVYDTQSQYTRKVTNLNNSGVFVDSTVFTYDGIDRRVLKTYKNATNTWYTVYLHGSSDNIMEERYRTGAAGTETIRQYIYGPTGLIAIRDNTTDYFVLKDHLGSTRVAFNGTTGAVIAYYDYSPFGKTARSYESGTIVKYTYTGQEKDSETGLMNYKARMYDPNIGRFYAMDPAGQTPSFYNYCGNNPVSFTDPSGEWFGVDDLIVSGVSFVFGYVSHGVTTGHWGKDAVVTASIAAGSAELAYLSGGAAAGLLFTEGSAGYALTASTVGGVIGGSAGSIGNQLYSTGKVNWTQVGRSAFAGGMGGIAGGGVGWYSGDPFLSGMVGGMVSGGIEGSYHGNAMQGAFSGMIGGLVSSGLTVASYSAYGSYLTNKYFGENSYGTDLQVGGDNACHDFRRIMIEKMGLEKYAEWVTSNGEVYPIDLPEFGIKAGDKIELPTHSGISLGRDQYGQHFILSKLNVGQPVLVKTSGYLSRIYGRFKFVPYNNDTL